MNEYGHFGLSLFTNFKDYSFTKMDNLLTENFLHLIEKEYMMSFTDKKSFINNLPSLSKIKEIIYKNQYAKKVNII